MTSLHSQLSLSVVVARSLILFVGIGLSTAFVVQQQAHVTLPRRHSPNLLPPNTLEGRHCRTGTSLNMFMGSDGGILGIGTPELFTILLVGYFVLGPSDLYKLVKEVGKFVQNIRTFATDATSTLENSFESQLQLEEIRKAQRELNDAFSFRRSINVEAESNPFEVNAQSPRAPEPEIGAAAAAGAIAAEGSSKKKRRRRVKKKAVQEETPATTAAATAGDMTENIPDLSEDDDDDDLDASGRQMMESLQRANEELRVEAGDETKAAEKRGWNDAKKRREERLERLKNGQPGMNSPEDAIAEREMAASGGYDESVLADEQSRFQSQLSGSWNDQVLSKESELSPMATIMEQLALLEEERMAADERLQEEFRLREENEEKFYRQKRKLLEEAAAKTQEEAYATSSKDSMGTKD